MAVHIFIAFDAFMPNKGNKSSSFQNQICFIAAFKISSEFSELHTKDFVLVLTYFILFNAQRTNTHL